MAVSRVSPAWSSIASRGIAMAVPPFHSPSGMGFMTSMIPSRRASSSASSSAILFFVRWCSWMHAAAIGLREWILLMDRRQLRTPEDRPSKFWLMIPGPGCGSIPSSVKSRIHSRVRCRCVSGSARAWLSPLNWVKTGWVVVRVEWILGGCRVGSVVFLVMVSEAACAGLGSDAGRGEPMVARHMAAAASTRAGAAGG
jgi:hypothetical protein